MYSLPNLFITLFNEQRLCMLYIYMRPHHRIISVVQFASQNQPMLL